MLNVYIVNFLKLKLLKLKKDWIKEFLLIKTQTYKWWYKE